MKTLTFSLALTAIIVSVPTAGNVRLPFPDSTALEYFRYVGGAMGSEYAHGCAVDKDDSLYIAGNTTSSDLLTTPGAFQRTRIEDNASTSFIAKLDPSGTSIEYLTYFGSTGYEFIKGVAVDETGAVYVVGTTMSDDLPVVGGLQPQRSGDEDVFLAKLDPTGSHLEYSTYLGSAARDYVYDVAYAGNGLVWICGTVGSAGFPTTPDAYLTSLTDDAYVRFVSFVTEIDTTAAGAESLRYSTLFRGGNGADAVSVAVDAAGCACVVGGTSDGLPATPNANIRMASGLNSGYVSIFDPTRPGSDGLVYCSYVADADCGPTVVALHDGVVYVAGHSNRNDFPVTANAVQPTRPNPDDGHDVDSFLIVLTPNDAGTYVQTYGTFYGGLGADVVYDLSVDAAGNAWCVGQTTSLSLRRTRDAIARYGGGSDGFVACIAPTLDPSEGLRYASYVGGRGNDALLGVVTDANGGVFVAGGSALSDVPVPTLGDGGPGNGDAMMARLQAPVTDVALVASAAMPSPAPLGGQTAIAYEVSNNGGETALGTAVVVDVPGHASVVSVVDAEGAPIEFEPMTGLVRIPTGTITVGRSAMRVITFAVDADAGTELSFAAHAESATVDRLPANGSQLTVVAAVVYPTVRKAKAATDATGAFTIVVKGANFRPGVLAYVGPDLVPWPKARLKGSTRVTLSGSGLKARFPEGIAVPIRLVNGDNSSVTVTVTR